MNRMSSGKRRVLLTWVALTGIGSSLAVLGADAPKSSLPPGFSTSLSGGRHDFDFLIGAWTTQQKRLKALAVGGSEWIGAPANRHCVMPYLGGQAIVEQSQSPDNNPAGLFIYTFAPAKQQWAIRWVNGKTGEMDPPSVGGFKGRRGEFFGDDEYNGHPIRVRVVWTHPDRNHARWEQSFSFDGKSWEVNWISDFTRGDPAELCPNS